MKKNIICFLLVVFGIQWAGAQTKKGNFFIGGHIGYNEPALIIRPPGYEEVKIKGLKLKPMGGIFLSENLATGLFLNYENSETYEGIRHNRTTNLISVGPFIRKYWPLNDLFAFYGQGSLGYLTDTNEKTKGFTAGLQPGFTFFPIRKIGVDLSVQGLVYNYQKYKNSDAAFTELNMDVNLPSLTLGFNYFIFR